MVHDCAFDHPGSDSDGTITVVDHVSRRALARRALGTLRTTVAYLLVLVAVLCAIPAVALLLGVALALSSGDGAPVGVWVALGGFSAAAFLLLRLGLRMARGRRHLVIFLRRFGFNDASQAVTRAVTGAPGRRWRIVTLDDTQVEAVGTRRVERLAFSIGRWVLLIALLLAVFGAVRWLAGDGIGNIVGGIFDDALARAEEGGANPFEAFMAAFFAALVGGIVVIAFIVLLGILVISSLGVTGVATWSMAGAIRRAEGSKALHVDTAAAIRPVVARVKAAAARIQAPRLVVVKVDDSVWRDVVRALSEEATVAVVDISDPSEHLAWEIALLKGEIAARLLLIGRRDRVEALIRGDSENEAAARLRALLEGEQVLVYDAGGGRDAERRFTRSLGAQLERVAS
jgi:hypothetical protein